MLFPGQGSQSVGMLDAWSASSAVVRDTLAEADAALGWDLSALIQAGPGCALDKTENTQPAMLVADVALWRVWQEAGGPQPTAVAGHSLGEYAALVAAGVLELADALPLVRERALAMSAAVAEGEGAMAAIVGLDADTVVALCAETSGVVEAVNFNAPTQIVVAGAKAAVDRACEAAKAAGARMARTLPVSVPAHSSLMEGARERLQAALEACRWQSPRIPLLHNVDAMERSAATEVQAALLAQVHQPVLWVQTQQYLLQNYACTRALECGPGNVLAGLGRRSGVDMSVQAFPSPESLQECLQSFSAEEA